MINDSDESVSWNFFASSMFGSTKFLGQRRKILLQNLRQIIFGALCSRPAYQNVLPAQSTRGNSNEGTTGKLLVVPFTRIDVFSRSCLRPKTPEYLIVIPKLTRFCSIALNRRENEAYVCFNTGISANSGVRDGDNELCCFVECQRCVLGADLIFTKLLCP